MRLDFDEFILVGEEHISLRFNVQMKMRHYFNKFRGVKFEFVPKFNIKKNKRGVVTTEMVNSTDNYYRTMRCECIIFIVGKGLFI